MEVNNYAENCTFVEKMSVEKMSVEKLVNAEPMELSESGEDYYDLVPYVQTKDLRREIVKGLAGCKSLTTAAAVVKGLMQEQGQWNDNSTLTRPFCEALLKHLPFASQKESLYSAFYRLLQQI